MNIVYGLHFYESWAEVMPELQNLTPNPDSVPEMSIKEFARYTKDVVEDVVHPAIDPAFADSMCKKAQVLMCRANVVLTKINGVLILKKSQFGKYKNLLMAQAKPLKESELARVRMAETDETYQSMSIEIEFFEMMRGYIERILDEMKKANYTYSSSMDRLGDERKMTPRTEMPNHLT